MIQIQHWAASEALSFQKLLSKLSALLKWSCQEIKKLRISPARASLITACVFNLRPFVLLIARHQAYQRFSNRKKSPTTSGTWQRNDPSYSSQKLYLIWIGTWNWQGISAILGAYSRRMFETSRTPSLIEHRKCENLGGPGTYPLSSAEAPREFWEGRSPLSKLSAGANNVRCSRREGHTFFQENWRFWSCFKTSFLISLEYFWRAFMWSFSNCITYYCQYSGHILYKNIDQSDSRRCLSCFGCKIWPITIKDVHAVIGLVFRSCHPHNLCHIKGQLDYWGTRERQLLKIFLNRLKLLLQSQSRIFFLAPNWGVCLCWYTLQKCTTALLLKIWPISWRGGNQ